MRHGLSFVAILFALTVLTSAAFARPAASVAPTAAAAPAATDTLYGVAEDAMKYADDGGASLYPLMRSAGLSVARWTIRPNTSDEAFVARALPVARANGIRIIASVHTERPALDHDAATFCAWLEDFARRHYPGIKDYVVWNEPNTRLFWRPQ